MGSAVGAGGPSIVASAHPSLALSARPFALPEQRQEAAAVPIT
jgi:hypothetical protein